MYMMSSTSPKNINGSYEKGTTEQLLDTDQRKLQDIDENRSTEPADNCDLIPIRGKYDLIADWGEPAFSNFNKKCL